MNDKEEFKTFIIECCINGTMTIKEAADRLKFSERYVKKLKARYKKFGASSMLHGNCGKQPEFEECNFEHFRDILEELYGIKISYTPLYNLLRKNGFKSPRKHKKVNTHKTEPSTQYGRIMEHLGVELIHAGSSQAKGRVERLWNTLHDRLRTEFRIHNIKTPDEANKFFKSFIPRFNKKFAVEAEDKKSSFMELPKYVNLDYLLSVKYVRSVDASNCISIRGTTFLIETKEILHKKKVEICISKRIGMKVRFNNNWYKLTPITSTNKKSLKSIDSVEAIIQQFIFFNCLKNERLSA